MFVSVCLCLCLCVCVLVCVCAIHTKQRRALRRRFSSLSLPPCQSLWAQLAEGRRGGLDPLVIIRPSGGKTGFLGNILVQANTITRANAIIGQFGTSTILHHNVKEDNLTPRTIWHHNEQRKIWHLGQFGATMKRGQFGTVMKRGQFGTTMKRGQFGTAMKRGQFGTKDNLATRH